MSAMTEMQWLGMFSDNLTYLLAKADMTQRELADACGMSESTVSKYVNGHQMPNGIAITKLANALDCSVSELIDFE